MSDLARSVLDADDPFAGGDVVPMRLGDAVIQRITQAIHEGRLKPGDSLPSEARIAASFGVSKPIAREAIRQLAAMGVVHIQQGKPTRVQALDAAPLDRFFRPGVKLDFSDRPAGHVVGAAEVEAELARIGHALQPLDIVLVQSGAVYGTDNFTDQGCGMGAEATLYLTERGVQVVGTDAWSWDAPFSHTAKRWAETRDPSIIWEGHKAGRIHPYYQIEKLTNLAAIPATGFTFSCFPVKIERASAGWIRAVALVDG